MSITSKLAKKLTNYDDALSFGSRMRAKRIAPLLRMMALVHQTKGKVNLIDVGGTRAYWGIVPELVLEQFNVSITILNIPGSSLPLNEGRFSFEEADGCHMPQFADKEFDIVHSNSVVEHVGDWHRMCMFANEVQRIATYHFVQTPNYWFPVEPHFMAPFFHWLPKTWQIWLVAHFELGNFKRASSISQATSNVESIQLLNRTKFQALFKESTVCTERVLGLAKSFVAVREPSSSDDVPVVAQK